MELPLIELPEVMQELERLGDERTKRIYMNHGAREPLFGVTVKALKPLAKKIRKDQRLAEQLYATGNCDAMYLAGMIADAKAMTEEDFDRWIDQAYFYMISDYIVAVTLAETDFAQRVADRWIASGEDLKMSAGWSCYAWLLGWRPDSDFNTEKLRAMLETVTQTIHSQPPRTRYSMNGFLIAVGMSYKPLHEEAAKAAAQVGPVKVDMPGTKCNVPLASKYIEKAAADGRVGFKRRAVRC